MTREDAIKILKSKMDGHTDTSYEWAETVRMAIVALEKENDIFDKVLELLDKVSDKASTGGVYWNSAQTIKVLRRRIMNLKGGEQE